MTRSPPYKNKKNSIDLYSVLKQYSDEAKISFKIRNFYSDVQENDSLFSKQMHMSASKM